MIDGYKILNLSVNINELLTNDLLTFPLKFNESDGEILENQIRISEYKGQKFIFKNNNFKLYGSFHKYHNNGVHNYNDFYFSDLENAIIDLCNKFKINPDLTKLNNLEFGVNIQIPVKPEEFFKYVINYRGKPFQPFNIKNAKGIECIKENFIIKMYDKGYQYNQSDNLLRFEIKVIRMQYFEKKGINIKTLTDLLNIEELTHLKGILRAVFNEILIYDYSIKSRDLNVKERQILSDGNNPKYWEKLLPNSINFENRSTNKSYRQQRKKYYRELDNFKKLIDKHSTSNLKNDISNLIEKQCIKLLMLDNDKRDKYTDISILNKKHEKGQIYISNIEAFCPLFTKQSISLN